MLKHIQKYSPLNESFRQHGIILIKGKPKKGNEKFLYAAHVNAELELKAGAKMLILSDTFYRVVKGSTGKLKGEKINWRSEDSLKSALNLKSPGKISLVKNNNKTPYHWKTLKHTNISDALSAVDQDLRDPDYVFESTESSSIETSLAIDAIRTAFTGEKTDVVIMHFTAPYGNLEQSIWDSLDEDNRGHGSDEWEVQLDCLYLGSDNKREYLKEKDLLRFTVLLTLYSEVSAYASGEDELSYTGVDTTIQYAYCDDTEIGEAELNNTIGEIIEKYISSSTDEDIYDSLSVKNPKFF
jgi:hypothetical protein